MNSYSTSTSIMMLSFMCLLTSGSVENRHQHIMNTLNFVQVTDNYCQDADSPFAWVHPLKETETLLEVARVSGACNW